MGSWSFSQIHVDAGESNEKIIRQFMECYFSEETYDEDMWGAEAGVIYPIFECLPGIGFRFDRNKYDRKMQNEAERLFYVVNRIINNTYVYFESDIGSNTSDGYDRTEIIFDPVKCIRVEGSYSFCWGEGTGRKDYKTTYPIKITNTLSFSDTIVLLKIKAEADKRDFAELSEAIKNIPKLNNVKSIKRGEFSYCSDITDVIIPDGVRRIGDSAFDTCLNLNSVVIPDSVTHIGRRVFSCCRKLTSVTIGNSVTSIEDEAFGSCESLTSVTIGNSVTSIGDLAFWSCKSLTSVIIPDSVTSIGERAFMNCENLTTITVPCKVVHLGSKAFLGCKNLADENGFVIINDILFSYYGNDQTVVIRDSVTSIGEAAFSFCKNLTSVVIPASVTSIEKAAFRMCPKLQYILSSAGLMIMEKLNDCNPLVIEKDGEKYRFFALSYKNSNSNYKDYIKLNLWNDYDLELINNGPKYKYRLPARLFGGLDRLLNPVDLTEENKQLYIELLKKNVKKMVSFAEEIKCPFTVKALLDLGIIDDSNTKTVKKLITASTVPEIAALSELFGVEVEKPKAKKKAASKKEEL